MIDEEERAKHLATLRTLSTPKLDELRGAIPAMRTSDLLGYLTNAETLSERLCSLDDDDEDVKVIMVAAVMELAEEIDRRIPPR